MHLSTLCVAVVTAAAAVTASGGSTNSARSQGPITVPLLGKRGLSLLQRSDGSIDWNKAQAHVAKVNGKYMQSAQALARRSPDSHIIRRRMLGDQTVSASPDLDDEGNVGFDDGMGVVASDAGNAFGKRAWDMNDGGVFDPNQWSNNHQRRERLKKRAPVVELRDVVKNPKSITNSKKGSSSNSSSSSSASAQQAVRTKASLAKQAAAGGVSLTAHTSQTIWTGAATIGGTDFQLDFDTGSAVLWVPGVSCASSGCAPHTKYDPSASSTSNLVSGQQLSIRYGDGSSTTGSVYTENISFGGITAVNQTIGVANTLSADWANDPMDGMAGMAFQSISQLDTPPFFQTLMSQGAVAANQFSFKLSTGASELYLGGMNSGLYQSGTTSWYALSSQTYWVISASAYINSQLSNVGSFEAIIDTGTAAIIAPTSEAQQFWASVPNSGVYGSGFYTYDCANPPVVSFAFNNGDEHWAVSSDSFNLGTVSSGSTRCVGAVVGADLGVSSWILGDAFLKNVYATFDFDKMSVGFSELS